MSIVKTSLGSVAEVFTLCTTENNKVSSANNLTLDVNLSDRSFMYIKNSKSPSIKPWKIPVLTLA